MSEVVLSACRELIDDAKLGCVDLLFKDVCLEICAKGRLVLTNKEFKELTSFAAEKIRVDGSRFGEKSKNTLKVPSKPVIFFLDSVQST